MLFRSAGSDRFSVRDLLRQREREGVSLLAERCTGSGWNVQIASQPGIAGLIASAARKAARGKGCYRALVRARCEVALAARCPDVVTQASPFSRPILERLGFETVADVTACMLEW